MHIHTLQLSTEKREQMIDITRRLKEIVTLEKIDDGIMVVYSPHTTAGITINENADVDVQHDILKRLDLLCPREQAGDRHREGNSAAHLKGSLLGTSQTVLIKEGKMLLGTWQGVYFCEFDGPRSRNVWVKVLACTKEQY